MHPPVPLLPSHPFLLLPFLLLLLLPLSFSSPTSPSIPTTLDGNALGLPRIQNLISQYICTHPPPINHKLWSNDIEEPGVTQYESFRLDKYIIIEPECYTIPVSSVPINETLSHYAVLETPPVFSIGIISASKNTMHRLAIRSTWLNPTRNPETHKYFTHKFFIALPIEFKIYSNGYSMSKHFHYMDPFL